MGACMCSCSVFSLFMCFASCIKFHGKKWLHKELLHFLVLKQMACNCLYYHAVTSSMTILVVPGHSADHVLFKPVLTRQECAMSTQWVYFLSSCDSSPHMQLVYCQSYVCMQWSPNASLSCAWLCNNSKRCLPSFVSPSSCTALLLRCFLFKHQPMPSPSEKWSGEQSQISWGLFQKVIRTNEMAIMCQSFTTVNLYSSICTFFEQAYF